MKYIASFILVFILITAFVFAGDTKAENTTGTNLTVNTSLKDEGVIEPLATGVSISVTPTTLNLGSIEPDGVERSFLNAAYVRIITRGGTLSFMVRANSLNLVSTTNTSQTIPISNLKYSINYAGPPPINVEKRSFGTTYDTIWTYPSSVNVNIPINYYMTIPPFTDPGTYQVQITWRAI